MNYPDRSALSDLKLHAGVVLVKLVQPSSPPDAPEPQGAERATSMLSLGIFWRVPCDGGLTLLLDKMPVVEAEPYGACLTFPCGHAETWERWRALTGRERRRVGVPDIVITCEYDDFPRGRIVADRKGKSFTVYADSKLHDPPWPTMIIEAFGLDPLRCVLMMDGHYRTGGG